MTILLEIIVWLLLQPTKLQTLQLKYSPSHQESVCNLSKCNVVIKITFHSLQHCCLFATQFPPVNRPSSWVAISESLALLRFQLQMSCAHMMVEYWLKTVRTACMLLKVLYHGHGFEVWILLAVKSYSSFEHVVWGDLFGQHVGAPYNEPSGWYTKGAIYKCWDTLGTGFPISLARLCAHKSCRWNELDAWGSRCEGVLFAFHTYILDHAVGW